MGLGLEPIITWALFIEVSNVNPGTLKWFPRLVIISLDIIPTTVHEASKPLHMQKLNNMQFKPLGWQFMEAPRFLSFWSYLRNVLASKFFLKLFKDVFLRRNIFVYELVVENPSIMLLHHWWVKRLSSPCKNAHIRQVCDQSKIMRTQLCYIQKD